MNASARQQVAVVFGTVLSTARGAAGFSQEQLAEAADVDRTLGDCHRVGDSFACGIRSTEYLWEPKLTSYTVRGVDESGRGEGRA